MQVTSQVSYIYANTENLYSNFLYNVLDARPKNPIFFISTDGRSDDTNQTFLRRSPYCKVWLHAGVTRGVHGERQTANCAVREEDLLRAIPGRKNNSLLFKNNGPAPASVRTLHAKLGNGRTHSLTLADPGPWAKISGMCWICAKFFGRPVSAQISPPFGCVLYLCSFSKRGLEFCFCSEQNNKNDFNVILLALVFIWTALYEATTRIMWETVKRFMEQRRSYLFVLYQVFCDKICPQVFCNRS